MEPHEYPKRILLAVTGLSPQVVTETLYYLAVKRTPPFIPTELHLLTTAEGASFAELMLLNSGQGHFARFCRDFGLEGELRLGRDNIHVIRDAENIPLQDIRTPGDNTTAADAITEFVRRFTADRDAALHVSLAGGRKTMGFYLGYALSLFGRPQDRLSHVLVNEPFEREPQFFYPPPEPHVIVARGDKPVSTRDAVVMLAEIPFVRLRHGLPEDLLHGKADFSAAVAAAQHSLGPPVLVIGMADGRVECGGREIKLAPVLTAFYVWLAIRCAGGHEGVNWRDADAEEFLAVYRDVAGELSVGYERASDALKAGFTKDYFLEKNTRVNNELRRQLGSACDPYLIRGIGKRPMTRYGLNLPVSAIRFDDRLAGHGGGPLPP